MRNPLAAVCRFVTSDSWVVAALRKTQYGFQLEATNKDFSNLHFLPSAQLLSPRVRGSRSSCWDQLSVYLPLDLQVFLSRKPWTSLLSERLGKRVVNAELYYVACRCLWMHIWWRCSKTAMDDCYH